MKIIIVGDGKVGLALTRQLSREDHDITVIDSNPRVNETLEKYDVMIVNGNGASLETLREAGVEEADLVIAATSSDEINMLCCVAAKYFADVHTIARVRNPAYAEQLIRLRREFGLSMTINPELQAANEIFHLLQYPNFLKRESFAKGRIEIVAKGRSEIVELEVKAVSRLADIPLHQLYQVAGGILVCAVERKGEITIPNGSFVLQAGDHIHVTAQALNLAMLLKTLEITPQRVRQVLIVGGSRTAFHLAKRLIKAGIGVKIIEQNHQRCLELAEQLPKASIIEGDGSQFQLLAQEGIEESNAVVTLTNMDEENIVRQPCRRTQGRDQGQPSRIYQYVRRFRAWLGHQPARPVLGQYRPLRPRNGQHAGGRQHAFAAPHDRRTAGSAGICHRQIDALYRDAA